MFTLAMEAKTRGMGVVGSTSNILDFIAGKVQAALGQPYGERLTFVLGTEAGMITSIVRKVQALIAAAGRTDVEVEVVFPVNPEAISTPRQELSARGGAAVAEQLGSISGLQVLPGPASGEGCSLEGGCASCPYMKMNTLAALMRVAERVGDAAGEATLQAYRPRAYSERLNGMSIAQAGCVPILHMRHFSQHKALSDDLVADITSSS
jgi:quinolinate synthase